MPDEFLCIVPEDCPENFTTFWSQGMQATYCRSRLTLPYAAEARITPFSEEEKLTYAQYLYAGGIIRSFCS
jgi:hypothetical protein